MEEKRWKSGRAQFVSILMVEVVRVFNYFSVFLDDAWTVSADVCLVIWFVKFDAIFHVTGMFGYFELL